MLFHLNFYFLITELAIDYSGPVFVTPGLRQPSGGPTLGGRRPRYRSVPPFVIVDPGIPSDLVAVVFATVDRFCRNGPQGQRLPRPNSGTSSSS